ncbi:MAG: sigma-54 dependent transcriptional regulator [Bacteroidetes bacterium]|nr:sigma-54 dependent transcriptional regulator [Bacteroidota bacterium]MBU1423393.1 sigma-54 dependent transcriptional regulator [Bacteroidota bacterium]MBU2636528.1 sigma-54 dependent transcriptional regulator [Bacteroidota bacterium]
MGNKSRILIVDDDAEFRNIITIGISNNLDSEIDEAEDGVRAINFINTKYYDLVLLDFQMPQIKGMEVLEYIKLNVPSTEVIMITGTNDIQLAIQAIKKGAYDYITKPIRTDQLLISINRALEAHYLRQKLNAIERCRIEDKIIGESEVWLALLEKAKVYANSDALIYIEGETGSGKEVIAKYIHLNSPRKSKPLITVDCSVIADSIIESELFGHVKGAYTGAESAKEGLIELSNEGILFIDEIGSIEKKFQQKLLKFVETKTIRRMGDLHEKTIDTRIIVASNKNLQHEIKEGRFIEDLWYRLNVLKLTVPPLRNRKEDILPLANYFAKRFSHGTEAKIIKTETAELLEKYSWPGNIRELQTTIQRACLISDDGYITPEDISLETHISNVLHSTNVNLISLWEAEKNHIVSVLDNVNWNISKAAKILQIGRNTLYGKLKEYNLKVDESF